MQTAKQMMPMGGLSMPSPSMSMMNGLAPLLCKMSCKMDAASMMCDIKPMGGVTLQMLEACCDMMNQVCEQGMPMTMICCNMSLTVKVECTMQRDGMMCQVSCMNGMTAAMMECCCKAMMQLCEMGMPMSMNCCGTTMMMCC